MTAGGPLLPVTTTLPVAAQRQTRATIPGDVQKSDFDNKRVSVSAVVSPDSHHIATRERGDAGCRTTGSVGW